MVILTYQGKGDSNFMTPFSALRPTEKHDQKWARINRWFENFTLINLGQKKLLDTLYLFFDVYVSFFTWAFCNVLKMVDTYRF